MSSDLTDNSSIKILLVEDEESLAEIISFNLEEESYQTSHAKNGLEALRIFDKERFDLIILDIMLPQMDGFQVFESIRLKQPDLPILFLTARDDKQDKIRGLKLGADDYITKPFDLNEFILRIKNILARVKKSKKTEIYRYSIGRFIFDFKEMKVHFNDTIIELSSKEAKLLKLLCDRKNEVVSRDEILELVWGVDVYPTTRTIDNFIVNLRKIFENEQQSEIKIASVRGIGYKLTF